MNLNPLEDRIICMPDDPTERSKGGIIIPDSAKERPRTAVVVAAGPGAMLPTGERKPMDVQVGDRVLFTKFSGHEITSNNEKYLIMRESDILAIVE